MNTMNVKQDPHAGMAMGSLPRLEKEVITMPMLDMMVEENFGMMGALRIRLQSAISKITNIDDFLKRVDDRPVKDNERRSAFLERQGFTMSETNREVGNVEELIRVLEHITQER